MPRSRAGHGCRGERGSRHGTSEDASAGWLHRRAENVASLMLAVMFVAFICQIVFRYLLNLPSGWASELTIVMWLWLVLWGAAFVVREDEEIRFDILYSSVRPGRAAGDGDPLRDRAARSSTAIRCRRSWDYVTFMKVQKTSYLDIRFDWLYSIYVLFAVAILVRYVWILLIQAAARHVDRSQPDGERERLMPCDPFTAQRHLHRRARAARPADRARDDLRPRSSI